MKKVLVLFNIDFLLLLFTLTGYSQSTIPGDTAGYTQGAFNVSETGAAQYSIPITVSPGTGGIQPTISLTYSSGGSNGFLGMGWSLQGFSIISRSSKTFAQDGYSRGVNLDSLDMYAIDGERLISITSAPYGSDGSEYRTEQEVFSRIISYGSIHGCPERFRVWTKGGNIISYGNRTDSRILLQGGTNVLYWLVDTMYDRNGNFMVFSYDVDTISSSYRPSRIDFTGNTNSGLVPYNSLQFIYEDRPDIEDKYILGSLVRTSKRLQSIKAYNGTNLVREYRFTYITGTQSLASLLSQVQECGSDGVCYRPTIFDWELGSSFGISGAISNVLTCPGATTCINDATGIFVNGDWNGDGQNDLLFFRPNPAGTVEATHFFINNGHYQFDQYQDVIYFPDAGGGRPKAVDFNSDGYTDLVFFNSSNGESRWFVNQYKTVHQFSYAASTFLLISNPIPVTPIDLAGTSASLDFGDINADGRPDIIWTCGSGCRFSDQRDKFFLNSGNNSFTQIFGATGGPPLPYETFDRCYEVNPGAPAHPGDPDHSDRYQFSYVNLGDWNNDGKTDIMFYKRSNGVQYWYTNNFDGTHLTFTGFEVPTAGETRGVAPVSIQEGSGMSVIDLNADGNSDIVHYSVDFNNGPITPGSIHFFINRGDLHFFEANTNLVNYYYPSSNLMLGTDYKFSFSDFNCDGKPDLFNWNTGLVGSNNFFISAGLVNDSLNFSVNTDVLPTSMVGDPNVNNYPSIGSFKGDGVLDMLWYNTGNNGNEFFRNNQTRSNYIKGITNGNGLHVDIEYTGLWNDTVYTKDSAGVYPDLDFTGGYFVVKRYGTSNGIDGINYVSYEYKGGKINIQGRGFRGFQEIDMLDESTGITQKKYFSKDFRFVGNPLIQSESWLGTNLISQKENKLKLRTYHVPGGDVFYSYVDSSIERSYELNGSLISTTLTYNDFDYYGNSILTYIDFSDGHRDSTISTFNNDTANWILSRLVRSEVSRFLTGHPTYKNAVQFEYNSVTGQVTKEISYPDSSNLLRIEKSYSHDNFGNIISSSTYAWNGLAMETRSLTSAYDATGRFEILNTNALGHTENKTYDAKLGKVLTSTGPNNLTTTYEYDGFGRLIRQTEPDGSWTKFDYRFGFYYDYDVWQLYTQTSKTGPVVKRYDVLDREIRSDIVGFDGTHINIQHSYNTIGEVSSVSDPFFNNDIPVYTTITYDAIGRKLSQTLPGNRIYTYQYNGYTTIETNPLNQTNTVVKNTIGQVLQTIDNTGQILSFDYNASGNLLSSTDPAGNHITNTYDIRNKNTSMHDPDMGLYRYTYNSFGELIKQIYPNGDSLLIKYDLLGRIIQRTEPEGVTNWIYDTRAKGIGKLSSINSYNGYHYDIFYDSIGRFDHESFLIDNHSYSNSFSYDSLGRILNTVYPSGFSVKNIYNQYGYQSEVRKTNDNFLYWKADSMNARMQLIAQQQGNGLSTTFNFDPVTSYLNGINTRTANQQRQLLGYSFNLLGNLTQRGDIIKGLTENFNYDALNRLVKSKITNGDSILMQYDGLGNITSKSDVGTYTYGQGGAGPHQVTSILLADTTICIPSLLAEFQYTSFNKVKFIEQDSAKMNIFYGPNRERILQQTYINDTIRKTKVYVGGLFEKIITDTLTTELHYISSPAGVIAVYSEFGNGSSNTEYWSKDHLGSLQLVTDSTGNVLEELSYDAWGNRRNADWSTDSVSSYHIFDRGFTGHEHLDLFSLVDMNGRVYDPVIGRFLSADPFIQYTADLQSYNRYSYVLNNPLSVTDPSGYWGWSDLNPVVLILDIVETVVESVSGVDLNINAGERVDKYTKENWKTLAVVAVCVGVGILTGGAGALVGSQLLGAILSGAAAGFASGVTATLLNGGTANQALLAGARGAAIGGVTAGATFGVGSLAGVAGSSGSAGSIAVKTAGHGLVQGESSKLQGGQFSHGFWAGALTGSTSSSIDNMANPGLRIAAAATVGGTASQISGGKFANGAIAGAFVRMYNDELHKETLEKISSGGGVAGSMMEGAKATNNGMLTRTINIGGKVLSTAMTAIDLGQQYYDLSVGNYDAARVTGCGIIGGYAGGTVGAAVAGPPGAIVGGYIGSKVGSAICQPSNSSYTIDYSDGYGMQ